MTNEYRISASDSLCHDGEKARGLEENYAW